MTKNIKLKITISSVVILLPIVAGVLLWDKLPDTLATHWGFNGEANGFASKSFAVFGMPLILLAGQFICLFCTLRDKSNDGQNKKVVGAVFWIIPIVSVFFGGIVYGTALGRDLRISSLTFALLGLLFVMIGNYLPKTKQNRTIGFRLPWTINDEENWNKTHRLAGKMFVAGGFILLFSIFLPENVTVIVMFCDLAAITLLPSAYSYGIYRQKIG